MSRNVAILWDDLLTAFTSMDTDRIYYLDRATGEIFFIGIDQEETFRSQVERLEERFIEIPGMDHATERRILADFIAGHRNDELRTLMQRCLAGTPPYASAADLISFFPEEEAELAERIDHFLSDRVKTWLEEHNLISHSASSAATN